MVFNYDKPGRGLSKLKCLNVHSGKVLDMQFNPFVESILATASDDCNVCITQVPEDMEDAKEDVTKAEVVLEGHEKRAHLLKWHPTANNIVASSSWDKSVKLWNVATQDCVQTYSNLEDVAYSMAWNADG